MAVVVERLRMALHAVETLTDLTASRKRLLTWQVIEISARYVHGQSQSDILGVTLDPRAHMEEALEVVGAALHQSQ